MQRDIHKTIASLSLSIYPYLSITQLAERVIWNHDAVGSSPTTQAVGLGSLQDFSGGIFFTRLLECGILTVNPEGVQLSYETRLSCSEY